MPSSYKVESDPMAPTMNFRCPEFLQESPTFWFRLVEAQFELYKVTSDRAKVNWTISNLPSAVSWQLQDVIFNNPDYETLKEAVIKRIAPSNVAKVQFLFKDLTLGDRTPSAMLREMKQVLGEGSMDECIMRELWIQRLPSDVQAILASARNTPLSDAALIADEAMLRLRPQVSVIQPQKPVYNNCVPPSPSLPQAVASSPAEDKVDRLINAMERVLGRLSTNDVDHQDRYRRSRRNSPSPRRHFVTSRNGYCKYHNRFGEKARRCEPGCTFPGAKQGN